MSPLSNFPGNVENFFSDLVENNEKQWFEKNRSRYEADVLDPVKTLVVEIGKRLNKYRPDIVAIPKIDKSIFRIYRDVRFSKDKTPYKTHQGIYFWEGERKKMECSGFYFHVEPGSFMIAGGMYMMSPEVLKKYRNVVSQPKKATELQKVLAVVEKDKRLEIGGKHYKKFPRGYDHDFQPNEYLLHNGVYAYYGSDDFSLLKEDKVIDFVMQLFNSMMPLHQWLVENI